MSNHSGRVFGLANLVVADASLMPSSPRCGTNLIVPAIADRLADPLGD